MDPGVAPGRGLPRKTAGVAKDTSGTTIFSVNDIAFLSS
jgi:hypothetical protein